MKRKKNRYRYAVKQPINKLIYIYIYIHTLTLLTRIYT